MMRKYFPHATTNQIFGLGVITAVGLVLMGDLLVRFTAESDTSVLRVVIASAAFVASMWYSEHLTALQADPDPDQPYDWSVDGI